MVAAVPTPDPEAPGTADAEREVADPRARYSTAQGRSVRIDGLSSLRPTPVRIQQRRLAAAAREVVTRMVNTSAGEEELSSAAERLEEVAELLGELPTDQRYEGFAEAANAGPALRAMTSAMQRAREDADSSRGGGTGPGVADVEQYAFFDQSPLIGLANPLSPPLELDYDPEDGSRLRGRVEFGPAYEGPPGCVHGGYVAAVFDELLGATQSLSGSQGMTAHLGVDYRSPTPLGVELVVRGWLERTEGRKIWARATLHAGERLCAEADALFLAFVPGTFEAMIEARDA